jgi:isopentenyl-diphosphate delta-isomerase type 2
VSTRSDRQHIGVRKAKHLEICVQSEEYQVETNESFFDELRFVHRALPEIDADSVETGIDLLGYRVSLPIFISSMTGGSAEGFRVNDALARAAQEARIPVGMGSFRVLFRNPEVFPHFHLKAKARDVPVFANLGGVQIRSLPHEKIHEMVKRLEADALVIHLNPAQELFQPEGDRDFAGILPAVAGFSERSPVPVIVKETGCGIGPTEAGRLLDAGATFVNVAGAGGTNWMQVEAFRLAGDEQRLADMFADWGTPTALLLAASEHLSPSILASGGVRNGMDVAKAIALGATAAGLALPFARAVYFHGREGVHRLLATIRRELVTVMTLTGSRTIESLRKARLWRSARFTAELAAYQKAENDNGQLENGPV